MRIEQFTIKMRFKGVIYHFASDANKEAFLESPSKYEPAYGGWCAWAMREKSKTDKLTKKETTPITLQLRPPLKTKTPILDLYYFLLVLFE